MMILDVVIAAGSLGAFFVGGWAFLWAALFKDYDEKDGLIQVS